MAKYRNLANPERHRAMLGLRSSSAASPQESRNKRLRTKQAIIARAIKESA